jgi:hypothetical protein
MGGTRKPKLSGSTKNKKPPRKPNAASGSAQRAAAAAAVRSENIDLARHEIIIGNSRHVGVGPGEGPTEPGPEPEPELCPGPGSQPLKVPLLVVSYNILCQAYFEQNKRQQGTCPAGSRSQEARHDTLMSEIDALTAGEVAAVLCLQEVGEQYLNHMLRGDLESRGFQVLFVTRGNGQAGFMGEGVVLCWRSGNGHTLTVLRHELVDLDECVLEAAAASEPNVRFCGRGASREGERKKLLPKPTGCVGLVATLRFTHNIGGGISSWFAGGRSGSAGVGGSCDVTLGTVS